MCERSAFGVRLPRLRYVGCAFCVRPSARALARCNVHGARVYRRSMRVCEHIKYICPDAAAVRRALRTATLLDWQLLPLRGRGTNGTTTPVGNWRKTRGDNKPTFVRACAPARCSDLYPI